MEIRRIKLQGHGDERGMLIALEAQAPVPFVIQRVYYLFATQPGVRRGMHAHRTLRQLAIAVRGSMRFVLDDGTSRTETVLECPTDGLLLEPMTWREMYEFSEDCVLMVLADQPYDPADYITDYAEFTRVVKEQRQCASLLS